MRIIRKHIGFFLSLFFMQNISFAQWHWTTKEIHTDFVTNSRQEKFDQYLRNNTLLATFEEDVDNENQYDYESACLSLTQFLMRSDAIKKGLNKMIAAYNTLDYSPKRALLAAIYAAYPTEFYPEMQQILHTETNPKLFAIAATYIYRYQHENPQTISSIIQWQNQNIMPHGISPTSLELMKYFNTNTHNKSQSTPNIQSLFQWNKAQHIKAVYSFQNWNRDYPGYAMVQLENGNFARDENNQLIIIQQLARAATNLPYFLTNGNTPQGIFAINGTGISRNLLIGPTPNLQTILPFEKDSVYWLQNYDSLLSPDANYLNQLPPDWRKYQPMQEAFFAGNCGRSEVIAHGATINPSYFQNQPFYPLVPTDGCMAGKEDWNGNSGYLNSSDQLNLANAYCQTPEMRGRYFVINISNSAAPIAKERILQFVAEYEGR